VHIYYNELWLVKNKTTTYCEQIDFLSSLPYGLTRGVQGIDAQPRGYPALTVSCRPSLGRGQTRAQSADGGWPQPSRAAAGLRTGAGPGLQRNFPQSSRGRLRRLGAVARAPSQRLGSANGNEQRSDVFWVGG
jgi:hypothetical protein